MDNTSKTVIHIPKLKAGQYLSLFHIFWILFKNLTDLQKVIELCFGKKHQNAKNLKIEYQQRSVKLKCLLYIFCHFIQQNLII